MFGLIIGSGFHSSQNSYPIAEFALNIGAQTTRGEARRLRSCVRDRRRLKGNKWAEIAKVLPGRNKVAACAKHFVGDGGTTKGINENDTRIEMNELLSIHMPPYVHSIFKGVSTNDKDDGYVIFTVLILHIEFSKEAFKLILILYVLYPPEGPRPQSPEKLRVMARKNSPQKKAGAILLKKPYV
ncbi:hypothetical protein QQ045_022658 [Rhodiola kirilowii]